MDSPRMWSARGGRPGTSNTDASGCSEEVVVGPPPSSTLPRPSTIWRSWKTEVDVSRGGDLRPFRRRPSRAVGCGPRTAAGRESGRRTRRSRFAVWSRCRESSTSKKPIDSDSVRMPLRGSWEATGTSNQIGTDHASPKALLPLGVPQALIHAGNDSVYHPR